MRNFVLVAVLALSLGGCGKEIDRGSDHLNGVWKMEEPLKVGVNWVQMSYRIEDGIFYVTSDCTYGGGEPRHLQATAQSRVTITPEYIETHDEDKAVAPRFGFPCRVAIEKTRLAYVLEGDKLIVREAKGDPIVLVKQPSSE